MNYSGIKELNINFCDITYNKRKHNNYKILELLLNDKINFRRIKEIEYFLDKNKITYLIEFIGNDYFIYYTHFGNILVSKNTNRCFFGNGIFSKWFKGRNVTEDLTELIENLLDNKNDCNLYCKIA